MFKLFSGRVTAIAALFAMAACAQAPRPAEQGAPLPPPNTPNQSLTYLNPGAPARAPQRSFQPSPAAQDVVLRGVAYAERGDGRFPPNSTLTLRVYDAANGDVNNPILEESFKGSGVLPWPYSMNLRREALRGARQQSVAGQIEGPDGQLIYRSEQAVLLVPGSSDDIPLVAVGAGGGNVGVVQAPARVDPFTGVPYEPGPTSQYGIPDINTTYGAPTFDSPTYPNQSFDQTTISGPPRNNVF